MDRTLKFIVLSALFIGSIHAATHNAATASRTDVLAAIALCSAGDTVVVPADTGESWAGGITITGITMQGAGTNSASGTVITAGTVTLTKHATHPTYCLGFRFTANAQHLAFGGTVGNRPWVVGDCYLFNDGATMIAGAPNGGLIYNTIFDCPSTTGSDVWSMSNGSAPGSAADLAWQAANTMGDRDTTGENNIYLEDCIWNGFLEAPLDVDDGTKVVIRFSTFNDSSVVLHGGGNSDGSNDTSNYGGRHLEMYGNTFNRIDGNVGMNKWVWMRGSSGVFVSNAVDAVSVPMYPDKKCLRLTVGCDGGAYARPYQFGQSLNIADSTPDFPYIILGNTGAGIDPGEFIGLDGNPLDPCADPSAFIQSGRDYVTSNTWGWAPYTYPHPLRNEQPASSGSPSAYGQTARVGTLRSP